MQFRSKNLSVVLACGPHKFLQIISAFLFCFREIICAINGIVYICKQNYVEAPLHAEKASSEHIGHCQDAVTSHRFWKIRHEHQYFLPSRHRPSIHSKCWLQVQIPLLPISMNWQVFAFSVPLHYSFILHVSLISLFAEKLKEFMNFSTLYTLRIKWML